jgi:hypothetical protein
VPFSQARYQQKRQELEAQLVGLQNSWCQTGTAATTGREPQVSTGRADRSPELQVSTGELSATSVEAEEVGPLSRLLENLEARIRRQEAGSQWESPAPGPSGQSRLLPASSGQPGNSVKREVTKFYLSNEI